MTDITHPDTTASTVDDPTGGYDPAALEEPAKAKVREAASKVIDDDKVSAEGRAQMSDNLREAGYE